MSSSSNDSEDDEVAKKIRLAVCDESIPMITRQLAADTEEGNQDGHDEMDFVNILSTTPGFRAHVSKQLCQIMDKKLKDSLSGNVWKCTKKLEEKYKGIHLFSNSKVRCSIVDNVMQESIPQKMDSHKARKHNEISSSESSLDEKISSCVFSQEDITKENSLLTGLQTCDQSTKRMVESMTDDNGVTKKCIKKKKRKKDITL